MKPSLENGGTVWRDTDNRRKPVVKNTGKERFQQQGPLGAREQGAETEGRKKGKQQKHRRARKKELPATKTPQSKGERNRDHREKEDQRTETLECFPLQRTQGERAHSNRGGPELQGEWRKKLTAAGRPQGKEERQGPAGERKVHLRVP